MSFSGTNGYITKPKPRAIINPLHPLSRGLVGYWLFNEMSGSLANDISGNKNHGLITNIIPNIQGSGWGGNKFGSSLQLNGTDNYVDCGYNKSLDLTEDLTIGVIINPTTVANYRNIIGTATDRNEFTMPYDLSINTFNNVGLHLGTGSAIFTISTGSGTVPLNKNSHIIATVLGTTANIYLNGILKDTDTFVGTRQTLSKLLFGARVTNLYFWDGSIVVIYMYNRGISHSEVKQLNHDPFCNLLKAPLRRYSTFGWTGKINSVTNPAKVCGISVADINKISGVS